MWIVLLRVNARGTAGRRRPAALPAGAAADRPSTLRGCFVRLMSNGAYSLRRVAAAFVEERGQLALILQVR